MTTIAHIARSIRDGETSARETVDGCFDRIDARDPALGSLISTDREHAHRRADEIDAKRARHQPLGPLAGVPVAIKDNICTSWGATTCGSRMLESFRPIYNAHVVTRLEAADAIVVGKANLDEFAMGSTTECSALQTTRNPWDRDRVPGGSSGGSVVAVASRMVPGALGSDTGGSVRLPASFCGVVGLKPSYGRVSRYGLVAYASSLDQIGPIATDVRDVALLLSVIAGHDPRDSTSVDAPVPDYVGLLDQPTGELRIGIAEEYFGDGLDAAVERCVRTAIAEMKSAGARLVPLHLPHLKYAISCYYLIATAEASSNLARFDGVHYGRRAPDPCDIFDLYARSRGEGFGAEVKRRIMLGTYALSAGYHDKYYLKALKVRTLIKRDFEAAFQQVDVIAAPVAPTTAFRIGEKIDDPLALYLSDIYTVSVNLFGGCAISVPCGFDAAGLPVGLQLIGPAMGEERLLASACSYQQRTDHHTKAPE
jgi:aspartyl-tRNA(Asn)/glutamyl-tRNA(Gln) amidotransferase subunit A